MKMLRCALLLATSLACPVSGQAAPSAASADDAARGQRIWADVKVLAADSMEGRRAGTPGHRRAAEFVAEQFRAAGLEPGGDDGWFQRVDLESRTIRESGSKLSLVRGDVEQPLVLGDEGVLLLRGNFARNVEAPLVFAGYGLKLPQYGFDDVSGLDLKGKIVVAFTAAPKSVPGAAGAHFGSSMERWKLYRAAGAVGVLFISNPFAMDLPWERLIRARFEPFLVLAPPAPDPFQDQKIWVQFNPARLDKLLAGAPHDAKAILAALEKGEPLPTFDLPVRLRATIDAEVTLATSENVIGVMRGARRAKRAEHVVLSAHLDHLGIASEVSEDNQSDRIYNGAMDNASGVAVLINVARGLRQSRDKPARSVVFAAVTAEESGLLGSRAFVARAQRQQMRIAADLNTDMFLPLFPLQKLIVFGLDESDLGADVRAVGKQLGIAIQPDPQPQRNRFIRSDQYSFIREGIPSLALKTGFDPGTPQAQIESEWFGKRYHAPSDDLDQPVDFEAMGRYAELLQRLALRIADRGKPPRWYETSAFAVPGRDRH